MSAERRRPLAGVSARAMVVLFLVVTFALTWLMFLPVILFHASGNFWSEILPLGLPAFDAAWVGEILMFGAAAAIVFFTHRERVPKQAQ